MPYKTGDLMVFISSKDQTLDTISISNVKRVVPDGPQIHFNELITAYRSNQRPFILLSAGYGKHSEAYLDIRGFKGGKQYLKDIENQPTNLLTTPYRTFNDVIVFEAPADDFNSTKTIRIYWSKSTGIIKFEQSDGEAFDLVTFESTETE